MNMLSGTIDENLLNPISFDKDKYSIWVSNNDFEGSIPSKLINKNGLKLFIGDYNKFDKLPIINGNNTHLETLTLSNNDIKEDNIGLYLTNVFGQTNLKQLLLHNNINIKGNINEWQNTKKANNSSEKMTSISLHNCSIYGEFSDNLQLASTIQSFTIFDNQLSCKLPKHLIANMNNNNNLTLSLTILGNLFNLNDPKQYNWINNYFKNASNLYLTHFDDLILYGYLIITGISVFIVVLYKTYQLVQNRKQLQNDLSTANVKDQDNHKQRRLIDDEFGRDRTYSFSVQSDYVRDERVLQTEIKIAFLQILNAYFGIVSHWLILVVFTILTVIYYVYSTFYQCGKITSHFSLAYFEFSDTNNDIVSTVICISLILIFVIFNGYILCCLFKMKQTQQKLLLLQPGKRDCQSQSNGFSIRKLLLCVIWFGLYLLGILFTILHSISAYLPTNNSLGIDYDWQKYSLKYSLVLVLYVTSTYITPFFIDSLIGLVNNQYIKKLSQNYRSFLIMFLRTILTIIIPFITSIFILNDCGRYWATFWNQCNDENSFDYDIAVSVEIDSANLVQHINALEHSDVCNINTINNINITQCLRQFFDYWIVIVTGNLVLVAINPFIILIVKKYDLDIVMKNVLHYIRIRFCKCCACKKNKNEDVGMSHERGRVIEIDSEYSSLQTKLELWIVFSVISPYLVIIISLSLMTNYIGYYIMINQMGFRVINWNNAYFPFILLFISCLMEQVLIVAFLFDIFNHIGHGWLLSIMIICFVLMDIVYIGANVRVYFQNKRDNN